MTSIEFPDGLTKVGNYAFYGCTKLTSIDLPDTVLTIGNYSFYNCTLLSDLYLGKSLTSIGSYAFRDLKNLTGGIIIPDSIASIGTYAFYGDTKVDGILIKNKTVSVGNNAFTNGPKVYGYNDSNWKSKASTFVSLIENLSVSVSDITMRVEKSNSYTVRTSPLQGSMQYVNEIKIDSSDYSVVESTTSVSTYSASFTISAISKGTSEITFSNDGKMIVDSEGCTILYPEDFKDAAAFNNEAMDYWNNPNLTYMVVPPTLKLFPMENDYGSGPVFFQGKEYCIYQESFEATDVYTYYDASDSWEFCSSDYSGSYGLRAGDSCFGQGWGHFEETDHHTLIGSISADDMILSVGESGVAEYISNTPKNECATVDTVTDDIPSTTWTIADPSIASIATTTTDKGIVTNTIVGLKPGKTTVTIKAQQVGYDVFTPIYGEGIMPEIPSYTFTVTVLPDPVDLTIRKIWDDENNIDGYRPQNVTIFLLDNDEPTEYCRELSGNGNIWEYTFEGIPESEHYTVIETDGPCA